jgi:hypothetical protein
MQEELAEKTLVLTGLQDTVEGLEEEVAAAAKMKDQLDE